jgi:hypothetical protein
MRAVGVLTTLVLGAAVVGAVAAGIRSAPDLKRYLAMRRM